MRDDTKPAVLRRLRVACGHLDAVVRMVESDAYCPEVMKQLSAVQGALHQANRLVLRGHLETCVGEAMRAGRTDEIVDELLDVLRYDPGPRAGTAGAPVSADLSGDGGAR